MSVASGPAEDIRAFVVGRFVPEMETRLTEEEPLFGSRVLDSVHLLEIVMFLERQYGIRVDAAEITRNNFATLKAIAKFTQRKLGVEV